MINDLYDELEQIFSIIDEWEEHDEYESDSNQFSNSDIENCYNAHVSQNYE